MGGGKWEYFNIRGLIRRRNYPARHAARGRGGWPLKDYGTWSVPFSSILLTAPPPSFGGAKVARCVNMEKIAREKKINKNIHVVTFSDRKKRSRGFALVWSRSGAKVRAVFFRLINRSRLILSIRYYGRYAISNHLKRGKTALDQN